MASIALQLLGKVLVCESGGQITHSRIVETEALPWPWWQGMPRIQQQAYRPYRSHVCQRGLCLCIYFLWHAPLAQCGHRSRGHGSRSFNQSRCNRWKDWRSCKIEEELLPTTIYWPAGQAKVCQALDIDKSWNKVQFHQTNSPLRIYEDGFNPGPIVETPRVGMSVHVGRHSHWPWRFYLKK